MGAGFAAISLALAACVNLADRLDDLLSLLPVWPGAVAALASDPCCRFARRQSKAPYPFSSCRARHLCSFGGLLLCYRLGVVLAHRVAVASHLTIRSSGQINRFAIDAAA